jgi:hypothetical protein
MRALREDFAQIKQALSEPGPVVEEQMGLFEA